MPKKKTTTETYRVTGDSLVKKVKELIHQGNIRRITIVDKKGKTLLVLPVTFGVIGVALAPVLAAVGMIAVFVSECSIKVEKESK